MSIARHHAEWLSLLEISGPFLSMPVLMDVFPQGLDAGDPELAAELRAAYEEWLDNQGGLQPDPAVHHAWIHYVLTRVLEMPEEVLAEGQGIPGGLKATIAEHHETIRPELVVVDPDGGRPRLLIQSYPAGQALEKALPDRNWKASPATRMMELLHATEVKLGLVTNGEQWLLVSARRGETTGFAGWYAALWLEERLTLRAFRSLLGVQRFFGVPEGETLAALLEASARDQQEVTDQLGYQVRRAVEILIQAIDQADQDRGRTLLYDMGEERLYEAALTVMMRLVFLLAAEERGLLLLGEPVYDQYYAASTLRAQLRETADQYGEELLERRYDAWSRLLATFRAVYGGIHHENLHLPAYGGSLFDPDRFPFLEGRRSREGAKPALSEAEGTRREEDGNDGYQAALGEGDPLPINNRVVLHLLDALQMLEVNVPGGGPKQARRLSFRALDIEQIGHVYEGLLDHVAVRATEPVLGLQGTKDREPEVALSALERFSVSSEQLAVSSGQSAVSSEQLAVSSEQWAVGSGQSAVGSGDELDGLVAFLREVTGRSESALRRALENGMQEGEDASRMTYEASRLRIACGNDEELYQRVRPWAGLIREDHYGYPVVIPAGSVYVTTGPTRRATGTHYTPRSLTEPIVQHTLEPLVYVGPAEGWPREKWQLRSPAEILALKVCDMAMGSGAFLVQADRWLAERLVEAWEVASEQLAVSSKQPAVGSGQSGVGSRQSGDGLLLTVEGEVTDDPDKAIPVDGDERLVLARRLVADRCLYGVDKNPLAVEMAKLSLWLVTLDKNRPFTFLDHALKHGDSLIGADEAMFLRWAHAIKGPEMSLFDELNRRELAEARGKRQALQAFTVRDVRDAEEKARLLAEAEAAMDRIKLGCDLLVGVRLLDDLSESEKEAVLGQAQLDYTAGREMSHPDAQRALEAAGDHDAFHWPFEFPEVFARGRFNAFVGNPPFLGGSRISTTFGDAYFQYLRLAYPKSRGRAGICALFFLRAFDKLSQNGYLGLIATNTISQADTREAGLDLIVSQGGTIYQAIASMPWPGIAVVFVSVVHIQKGSYSGDLLLNGAPVQNITPQLDSMRVFQKPKVLQARDGESYRGSVIVGIGFTLPPEDALKLIEKERKNEAILFPYLNGQDLNTNYDLSASRWVINFHDWPLDEAETFTEAIKIVRENVKPHRDRVKRKVYRELWWQYAERQKSLYESIATLKRVIVRTRVTQTHAPAFVSPDMVFSDALVVIGRDDAAHFSVLQSSLHEYWAWQYGSTLKQDLRYSPTDCYQTFPFPNKYASLEEIGEEYHEYRLQIMRVRQKSLTVTYNRFHDPNETASDIAKLRELHVEMDNAVAAAYGWSDLDLGHGFHETPQGIRYTISEAARREVLARLLKLNHEHYEEEVKLGLHEKKGRRKKGKRDDGQMLLL